MPAVLTDEDEMLPTSRIRAVAADEHDRQRQLARHVREWIALGAVDPVGAEVHSVARPCATPDTIASFEDGDLKSALRERARGSQPGDAGPKHQHALGTRR